MKQEIFIHVGLMKTGTTWLQKEFFPKLDLKHFNLKNLKSDQIPKDKKILISDEMITYQPTISIHIRETIIHGLKARFPNAKIILVLRDEKEHKRSMYNWLIKNSQMSCGFKKWEKQLYQNFYDYQRLNDLLYELFDDVFVIEYIDLKFNKELVLKEICRYMNVDLPKYKDKKINFGSYGIKQEILLNYNRIFVIGKKVLKKIIT